MSDKAASLPPVFWYLRDGCEFPIGWRLYAAWKMLVAPNSMAAALVLHGMARLQRETGDTPKASQQGSIPHNEGEG